MFGTKLLRRRYNRYFQKPAAWSIHPDSACALRATDHRYVPPPGYYTPDWVFANLDLSGLSTGLLQEHGTPFTRLSAFNGDPDSTTISTPLRCRLVQATLLSATVNANAQVDTAALPAESGSDTFSYLKHWQYS
jgi:hypothetical protein